MLQCKAHQVRKYLTQLLTKFVAEIQNLLDSVHSGYMHGFDLSTYLRNLSGDFACEGSDFGPAES